MLTDRINRFFWKDILDNVHTFLSIAIPYLLIQAILRCFLGGFSVNVVGWDILYILPTSIALGLIYDIWFILHIILIFTLFIALTPLPVRISIIGKILLILISLVTSFLFLISISTEIWLWHTQGIRFHDTFFNHINSFIEALSFFYSRHSKYINTAITLPVLIIGLTISKIIFIAFNKNEVLFLEKTKKGIAYLLISIFFLIGVDILNNHINIINVFSKQKNELTHGNRYIADISKNGMYNSLSNNINQKNKYKLSYLSFNNKNNKEELSILLKDEVKEDSSAFLDNLSIKHNDTDRVTANNKNNHPKNVIIILLSHFNNHSFSENKKIYNMPYVSNLLTDSMFFSSIHAISNITDENIYSLLFGSLPWNLKDKNYKQLQQSFSLGNVLEDNGYIRKFFTQHNTYTNEVNEKIMASRFKHEKLKVESNALEINNIIEIANRDNFSGQGFVYIINNDSLDLSKNRPIEVDNTIKTFIEQAKERPWFKDTVFIITAEKGSKNKSKIRIDLNASNIPLIIHNNNYIEPKMTTTHGSIIDIAPTILSLLGINYINRFQGIDLIENIEHNRAFFKEGDFLSCLYDDNLIILGKYKHYNIYKNKLMTNISINNKRGDIDSYENLVKTTNINNTEKLINDKIKDVSFWSRLCQYCKYINIIYHNNEWIVDKAYVKYFPVIKNNNNEELEPLLRCVINYQFASQSKNEKIKNNTL